jgi:hypothetical protein
VAASDTPTGKQIERDLGIDFFTFITSAGIRPKETDTLPFYFVLIRVFARRRLTSRATLIYTQLYGIDTSAWANGTVEPYCSLELDGKPDLKGAFQGWFQGRWLRGLDSNQDSRLQRPMCYQLHHPGSGTPRIADEHSSLS